MLRNVAIIVILLIWGTGINGAALEIMLPQVYSGDVELTGWLMSEKLDGVRA